MTIHAIGLPSHAKTRLPRPSTSHMGTLDLWTPNHGHFENQERLCARNESRKWITVCVNLLGQEKHQGNDSFWELPWITNQKVFADLDIRLVSVLVLEPQASRKPPKLYQIWPWLGLLGLRYRPRFWQELQTTCEFWIRAVKGNHRDDEVAVEPEWLSATSESVK